MEEKQSFCPVEKGVRLMVMKELVVNVLWAFAVCVLVVTLALLLVPSVSGAAILEWITTQPPSPCACVFTDG